VTIHIVKSTLLQTFFFGDFSHWVEAEGNYHERATQSYYHQSRFQSIIQMEDTVLGQKHEFTSIAIT